MIALRAARFIQLCEGLDAMHPVEGERVDCTYRKPSRACARGWIPRREDGDLRLRQSAIDVKYAQSDCAHKFWRSLSLLVKRMKTPPVLTLLLYAAAPVTTPSVVLAQTARCNKSDVATINGKTVWRAGAAVGFRSARLAVDADGAPNSYRVDGKGLSFTCDGVTAVGSTPKSDPDNWQRKCRAAWKKAQETGDYSGVRIFGFLTGRRNIPLIQKDGDPLPRLAYISTTSVDVPDGSPGTQRRYVDAVQIPYVVLSGRFLRSFGISPGDVGLVYRPRTGRMSFAVYGDGGNLGEASVRLHEDIGNDPIKVRDGVARAKRGIDDAVITIMFPGSATHRTVDAAAWRAEIESVGGRALSAWGGADRVKACAR